MAPVADIIDHALGISEPFTYSQASAHVDCGPWAAFRTCVHSAFIKRLVDLVFQPNTDMRYLANVLDGHYSTLRTAEEGGESLDD